MDTITGLGALLFGGVAFVCTAVVSVGEHSHIHDVLARIAMFFEALVVGAVLTQMLGWAAVVIGGIIVSCCCAVGVLLTDDCPERLVLRKRD